MITNFSSWRLARRLLAALWLTGPLVGSALAQTPTFAPAATFSTGGFPTGIAVADVNGDGKPDLLTTNSGDGTVGVLLGTGTGTFQAVTTYSSGGTTPNGIAVADVNGDSKPDLLVANLNGGTVGVLLNTGTGTFQAVTTYSSGSNNPFNIAVADFNGDGKPDLLTTNSSNGTIGVLLGTGTGAFQAVTTFSTGGSTPYGLAVTDVNGDGKLDLLVANSGSNNVGVLLGTGTGAFQAAATYGTGGTAPRSLVVADVNGDGKPDLLAANASTASSTVGVLLGTGTGTFQAATTFGTGGSRPYGLAVADVNGDGKPDLLTANLGGNNAGELLGTGTGAFQAATTFGTGGSNPYNIAAADVNGDGKPDLLVTNFLDDNVGVLLNTTSYALPTLTSLSPTSGLVGTSVTLTGTNLSSATAVRFNGTAAAFTANTDGTLTATVPSRATSGPVTVTTPGGTSNGVAFTVTQPITATTWTGTISSDWFTAGNWTAGVPTVTTDATISASAPFQPFINSGTATTRSLTLNSGSQLSMSGGTLDVRGNLTDNGTFQPTGGTVVLGTTTQSNGPNILGSSRARFWNLTVNAGGLVLSTSIGASVRRVLTLNGTFTTQNNEFVLESDATGTALVVNNGATGFVFGTATVQRYIDPSRNAGLGYHHYSPPVSGATVNSLATVPSGGSFTPVVNPDYNSSPAPSSVSPYPTVFGYDEQRVNLANNLSAFDKGYVSPTSLSDPLVVGRGYSVNIGASELVNFRGPLNNGTQTVSLTSARDANSGGGWQLLGNPYPAPLDLSLIAADDRAGLDAATYIYSSTSQYGGQFRSYVNNTGTGNPVVPVAQGFFMRVSPGRTAASITFRNSQRLTTSNNTAFQRPAERRPLVQLALQGAGSDLSDETTVYFEQGATAGFDPRYDAAKLPNPSGLNLAVRLGGEQLAIAGQGPLGTGLQVLPLAVEVPAPGSYTLSANQLLNLSGVPVYLRDLLSGAVVDLTQQPSYAFTASSPAALASRFELVFSPQQALATAPAALAEQVGLYPNPAKNQVALELPAALGSQAATATLVDALGRTVRTLALPAQGAAPHQFDLRELSSGIYALRLSTSAGVVVKKLTVE